jgi:hypothetical protein
MEIGFEVRLCSEKWGSARFFRLRHRDSPSLARVER